MLCIGLQTLLQNGTPSKLDLRHFSRPHHADTVIGSEIMSRIDRATTYHSS
jgi:hypothetical protein